MPPAATVTAPPATALAGGARAALVALAAFLTVVDLFAAQAILPPLTRTYGVAPAAMGVAVNASTLGMAVAGLLVAFLSRRIDRRLGAAAALALLAVPTTLLASAPDLMVFTALRIAQGLCMASAFTLTLAYLGEQLGPRDSAAAFAAYITGNVASNLFGRLMSAGIADHFGVAASFYVFAALNLSGSALVYFLLTKAGPTASPREGALPAVAAWTIHLRNPATRAGFGVGFCILFAFIGTFTYVNFVLVREPFAIKAMELGLIYFAFLPSIITTPLAGNAAQRYGTRPTIWAALAIAGAGLPLLLLSSLAAVLAGMVLVGVGTFFAQAIATGFVSRAAASDRGSASGLYLASYFAGGMAGSAILGQLFDRLGWQACVAGVGVALAIATVLAVALVEPEMTYRRCKISVGKLRPSS